MKNLLCKASLLFCLFFMAQAYELQAQKYCYPSFSGGCSSGDSIYFFQVGSYSRTSGCSSAGLDSSQIKTSAITLYRGKSYSVVIKCNKAESFGVFIDYNKNGSFSDPGELVVNDANNTYSTYVGNFTVPIDATPQTTRLRVMVSPSTTAVDYNTSCSSLSAGEIEDYLVTIGAYSNDAAIVALNAPQNLACPSGTEKVQVTLRNVGSNTLSNFPVSFKYGTSTVTATYNRTLISNSTDTFTVGTFNASSSATYSVKVYTNLSSDGDRTNDTVSASVDLKQPASPSVTTTVNHCGPGSLYLKGTSVSTGAKTYWYTSSSSTTPVAISDSIQVPYHSMGTSATYYAESKYPNTYSLTKGAWSSARANKGNMFDIFAKNDVTIDSFDVNISTSAATDSIYVYYKKGSYLLAERDASQWTKVGAWLVNGKGTGNATRVPMNKSIPLSIGNTYGFYIVVYSGSVYYDTVYKSTNPKSNTEMTITAGASLASLFATGGSVVSGARDWNGTVYYHYTNTCSSPRVPTTANFLLNPNGSAISKGTPFAGSYLAGTAANPDQICITDTNTYTLTPPSGMTNADFGTKWVVTALSFATAKGTTTKDTVVRLPTSSKAGYLKFFPSSNADSIFILKATLKIPSTGCDSTLIRYIKVNTKPKAVFTISNACLGKVIPVTNSSTPSTGLTYKWYFGNGDSATGATPLYKYFTAGTYTVTLVAINGPCSSTATQTVTVYPSPYGAAFVKGSPFGGTMNTGDIFDPDNVCVTDTNTYQITAPKGLSNSDYGSKWTITNMTFTTIFGNKLKDSIFKKPTSTKNATFSFFPSSFVDSIMVLKFTIRTLPGNCDSLMTRYIHIRVKPTAKFTFTNACYGYPVVFKDKSTVLISSVSAWLWDFGDGVTSKSQNPSHTYAKAGKYNVTLTAFSDAGCPNSVTQTVETYPRPLAKYGTSLGCNEQTTVIKDSASVATGSITSWKYTFGDGGSSALQTPSHVYKKSGPYTMKQVVTSDNGCKDSLSKKIRILPVPAIAYTYLNACVGSQLYFANNTFDSAGKTTYLWDFGDSTTSKATAPSHTYLKNGTFATMLVATSGNGCKDTLVQNITPYARPVPNPKSLPACVNKAAYFADSSNAGTGSSYTWDFGDGSALSTIKQVYTNHTYKKSGSYTVSLSITNGSGCIDSAKTTVSIIDLPKAAFKGTDVCLGKTTVFTNNSTQTGTSPSYLWDFGDGSAMNKTASPTHKYGKASTYTVKMWVYNALGCPDSVTSSVTVNPLPVIAPWVRKQTGYTVTFEPQDTTIGNFKWYFGTGTNDSSSLKKPTFSYPTADAKYGVKVVVTTAAGCVSSRVDTVGMGIYGIERPGGAASGITIYPNPFEGITHISYTLDKQSHVMIRVTDIQGKDVAVLKDASGSPGSYSETFDAAKYHAADGVYFIKIYVDDKCYTSRIVNMKK